MKCKTLLYIKFANKNNMQKGDRLQFVYGNIVIPKK